MSRMSQTELAQRLAGGESVKDDVLYNQGISNLRNRFLGKGAGMKSEDVRTHAIRIRQLAVNQSGMLDALVGISFHNDANDEFEGFINRVRAQYQQEPARLFSLTPQDLQATFSEYTNTRKQTNIQHEQNALKHYEAVFRHGGFSDSNFSPDNIAASQIDLEYRIALRDQNPMIRKTKLDALQMHLLKLASRVEKSGIRAEHHLVWLLRHLVRGQEIDHLVFIEHGTISQDLKAGPDIIISSIPWGTIGIQLKTMLQDDDYSKDFNEEKIERARVEGRPTTTRLLILDPIDLNNLMTAELAGTPDDRKRKKLLEKLKDVSLAMQADLFDRLSEPAKITISQPSSSPSKEEGKPVVKRRPKKPADTDPTGS